MTNTLKERILSGGAITVGEAEALAAVPDREALYRAADEIRRRFCSEEFDTCSIVNARSGRCSEDCKWCAQSAFHNTGVATYAMKPAGEMISMAEANAERGVGRFCLVTSGRRVEKREMEEFCKTYREVHRRTGMKLCASMGLIGREELHMLKDAGVTRYECNLETAPSFFASLCTTHTVEQKMQTLRMAREMGFELCSGGIIGMGESMSQRIELAMALRELGVKSAPINILNPIKGTALADRPPLTDDEILTTVALFRFVLPDAFIRFAGGRVRMSVELQRRVLRAGLNASLVGGLLTTAGTNIDNDYRLFREAGYRVAK
jgi:biotin synthase